MPYRTVQSMQNISHFTIIQVTSAESIFHLVSVHLNSCWFKWLKSQKKNFKTLFIFKKICLSCASSFGFVLKKIPSSLHRIPSSSQDPLLLAVAQVWYQSCNSLLKWMTSQVVQGMRIHTGGSLVNELILLSKSFCYVTNFVCAFFIS